MSAQEQRGALVDLLVELLEGAIELVGDEAARAIERAARDRPFAEIRERARDRRLRRRLARIRERKPTAFREFRERLLLRRLEPDVRTALLEALDALEKTA